MCRWLVFLSEEDFLLADVVIEPANSLIKQSFDGGFHPGLCETNNMPLNADGFGLGWYGRSGAAIFRSVTPAWNNRNLRELCRSVESSCVFAHVRAATPGSVISESNCHPFRCGPLLFQHNGHIEQYARIKRRVLAELRDDVFGWLEGTTDSEACFALVLNFLEPALLRDDHDRAAPARVPVAAMRAAMLGAIALLRKFLAEERVTDGFSSMNFALTDGHTVVVTRYCDQASTGRLPPLSR